MSTIQSASVVASGYDITCPDEECGCDFVLSSIPAFRETGERLRLTHRYDTWEERLTLRVTAPYPGFFTVCPECKTVIEIDDFEHAYD